MARTASAEQTRSSPVAPELPRGGVPPGPTAEVGTFRQLRAGGVRSSRLGDVRGAGAGGVQAVDHRAVLALDLAVDGAAHATEGEAGVQGLAEGEVVGAPRSVVLRRDPVRVLVELRV